MYNLGVEFVHFAKEAKPITVENLQCNTQQKTPAASNGRFLNFSLGGA